MKPHFALSLSFDGIRLLQRAAGGWYLLGEASVSDPNLTDALSQVRARAMTDTDNDLRTKLIIPDEQIKYLSIDTPGLDDTARRAAAEAALDGATPYAVDALAFDISPDGARTHVAAVARETLLEAEAFASEHGFHPVSFVAAGEGAEFLGEPFFGPTGHSKTLLAEGTTVEPDGVRVVVIDAPDEVVVIDAPEDGIVTEAPEDAAIVAAKQDSATSPEPPLMPTTAPEAVPPASAAPTIDAVPDSNDATTAPALAPTPPAADAQTPPGAAGPVATRPSISSVTASAIVDNGSTPLPPDAPQNPTPDEVTTPPLLGFATRRRQTPTTTVAPARLGGASRTTQPPRTIPPVTGETTPPSTAPIEVSLTTPPQSAADSLRPAPAAAPLVAPNSPPVAPELTAPPVAPPKTADARPGGFLSRRKSAVATQQAGTRKRGTKTDPEAERLTVFGARDNVMVGGKPRFLGLILMAALLVFLAGVAAWATVFKDDGFARLFQGRDRTLASTLPDDASDTLARDVGATTNLESNNERDADGIVVAALNDQLSDHALSAEDAAVLDALRDPLPDPVAPEELDAAALEARYAVTGIWPQAPTIPAPATQIELEDLYVTGIDPVSPALDAIALPALASLQTDRQLALVTSPVAAGTVFARGLNGRLIPTPDGALSPDGFTVYLGRPPAVPPATLVRLETGPVETAAPSALAQVRPQLRPSDLVEQNERATLGGLSRTELAGLRPRLRPQAPQEIENILRDVITEDDAVVTEDDAADEQTAPPSALAAAASLRPETRPRNFNRIVARTRRNVPSTEPAETRTAAVAPRSVAPRTVSPAIPSAASVAREATVRNAINLRQTNLIGVYGTPANRRALVRLKNGRYQKVEVGDRFDGGRVSAIGDSELRYQKGNQNLILKIPQG